MDDENCFPVVSASAAAVRSDHRILVSVSNGSVTAKQRARASGSQILQTADVDVSKGNTLPDVVTHAQPNLDSTEQTPGPSRVHTQPRSETRKYQGAVHGLHTLNEGGDWLNISLKFPTHPALNVLGVDRDDLRLSLDVSVSPVEDSREFEPREGKEEITSGAPPVVIISSAEDVICGNQPGDLMRVISGNLPICNPQWVRDSDSRYQWLPAQTRGTTSQESLTQESRKCPLVLDTNESLEIPDPSFDHHTKPQGESGSFSSYRQIMDLGNFGINDCSGLQLSLVQTVAHCSGVVSRSLASRKPMCHPEDARTMVGVLDSQPRDLQTAGKTASERQNELPNPVTSVAKLHVPCQSIPLDLNKKPATSRYRLSSCRSHELHLSTLPCGLHEQSKLPLNSETSFIQIEALLDSPEFLRCKLAPLPRKKSATLPTRVIMEEQCEHCQMEVAVPLQLMYNQVDGTGDLKNITSKIAGVSPLGSTSTHSNPLNDRTYSGDSRHFFGAQYALSAQVFKKPQTQGCIDNLCCKGLYFNDVACCSSRLPPREANRAKYIPAKVDKVGYIGNKIVNQLLVVESSDTVAARRISMNKFDCSRMDAVNFHYDGKGEAESQRIHTDFENYIHRTHGILDDLEYAVSGKGKQSREHILRSQRLQKYSSISLLRCPLSYVSAEQQVNCKRKFVMSVVDKTESENTDLKEVGKCAVTSLTSLTEPEFSEKWNTGSRCDLCNTGASLSLGEWYVWCCGLPVSRCRCPEQKKIKKQMAIGFRKTGKLKSQGLTVPGQQWSGKVHKMCALWSSEVRMAIFCRS